MTSPWAVPLGGATGGAAHDGALSSSGGNFNADNHLDGAYDHTYADCSNSSGCISIYLRMTFY